MEEDQTMAAFGQKPQPETDPVSGNPVPPGGTPEGVRDDIDAKLSEGEFVIPAHVVRFVGVTQLLQLIQAAEQGIKQMEQGGMMGQPVAETSGAEGELPFDPATLETEDDGASPMEAAGSKPGFSTGGLVDDTRLGKAATTTAASQMPSVAMYRDRTGFIRAVPIINGQPVGVVPPGAELISGPGAVGANQQQNNQQNRNQNQTLLDEQGGGNSLIEPRSQESYDARNLSGPEARSMLSGQRQISDFTSSTGGRVARTIASMVPGLGPVMSLAGASQQAATNALANRVLQTDYGAPSASLMDNLRGRTSFEGAFQLGKPADLLDQLDRGRQSGGANITTAEHTRTPSGGYDFGNKENIQQGWGYVVDVTSPDEERGNSGINDGGPGWTPDTDESWGSGPTVY